jgi:hypothetical protein
VNRDGGKEDAALNAIPCWSHMLNHDSMVQCIRQSNGVRY